MYLLSQMSDYSTGQWAVVVAENVVMLTAGGLGTVPWFSKPVKGETRFVIHVRQSSDIRLQFSLPQFSGMQWPLHPSPLSTCICGRWFRSPSAKTATTPDVREPFISSASSASQPGRHFQSYTLALLMDGSPLRFQSHSGPCWTGASSSKGILNLK